MIPPLPFQPSSLAHSGPPSDAIIDTPTPSRNDDPFLNQFMVTVVPPADTPLPTLEEDHVLMSSTIKDNLPDTIGIKVMPTNGATSYFTPKMPGE